MYLDPKILPRARGYKVAGAKMLPRDPEAWYLATQCNLKNARARKRDEAKMVAEMSGYNIVSYRPPKKRMEKRAERAYYGGDEAKLPRAARRILNEVLGEEARNAEEKAYGRY